MRSRNVYGRQGKEKDSPRVCKSKRRRECVKGKEDEDEDEYEVCKKIGYFKKKKFGKGTKCHFIFVLTFLFLY